MICSENTEYTHIGSKMHKENFKSVYFSNVQRVEDDEPENYSIGSSHSFRMHRMHHLIQ